MALLQESKVLYEQDTQIKAIFSGGVRVWPTKIQTGPDYTEPFYVQNITNENEKLNIVKSADAAPTLEIEYSTDRTTWQSLGTTSTTALTYTLQAGDKVYLRCSTNNWYATPRRNTITGVSKVGGNIMSLLYGSNFTGQETNFPSESTFNFSYLFYNNDRIIDASNLLLPATTLTYSCYYNMFRSCTSLTTAPELPATTLADYCYDYMFFGCTALTSAPELPATTLTNYCYGYMFYNCTALTTAPELPATTLAARCYNYMFFGCTALTSAPELPATTLIDYCYGSMFYGCTALTTVKCLATDISATNATLYWLSSVSATGTFTCASGMSQTWPSGANGIPSGWTVQEV